MNLTSIHSVYLIGIGGIGMSALARWFKQNNYIVGGYDKTILGLRHVYVFEYGKIIKGTSLTREASTRTVKGKWLKGFDIIHQDDNNILNEDVKTDIATYTDSVRF